MGRISLFLYIVAGIHSNPANSASARAAPAKPNSLKHHAWWQGHSFLEVHSGHTGFPDLNDMTQLCQDNPDMAAPLCFYATQLQSRLVFPASHSHYLQVAKVDNSKGQIILSTDPAKK